MAKYFNEEEFACQYTGKNEISSELIDKLDELREACGFPFVITSGYRDKTHPVAPFFLDTMSDFFGLKSLPVSTQVRMR